MSPTETRFIEPPLCAFVAERSGLITEAELTPSSPLFSSGLLDSMAFLELVMFVEERFAVRLSDAGEVTMEALDTVGAVARAVAAARLRRAA